MENKFPSIDDVHEVLSDLTKLFDDRNDLLRSMFKEDKYKDFLVAENMQQLAEADKRDDSANGRIKKDLEDGYEVLKAKTTMKKFASFISPAALPLIDLSSEEDFKDEFADEPDPEIEEKEDEEEPVEQPEKGEKGDKGDKGDTPDIQPQRVKGFDHIALPGSSQNSGLKLAEGGAVSPSPMMKMLNPSAQRPETKSGVKSLESLGLVGKKNVASELVEDLGLDKFKKALAKAMALPLKAVAAGLAGLLDNLEIPEGGEGVAKQIQSIGQSFNVPVKAPKKKKNPVLEMMKMVNPIGMLAKAILPKKKKSKVMRRETSSSFSMVNGQIVKNESSDSGFVPQGEGGPSLVRSAPGYLGSGGPTLSSEGSTQAPDNISTRGDTKIDAMKNTFNNITQGAKNIFAKSTTGRAVSATTSVLNRILGGIKPASEGSQYQKQNINSLTNQVIENNEQFLSQNNELMVKMGASMEEDDASKSIMKAIENMTKSTQGINESDPLPATELAPSKFLVHSITITQGGETPHDIA